MINNLVQQNEAVKILEIPKKIADVHAVAYLVGGGALLWKGRQTKQET